MKDKFILFFTHNGQSLALVLAMILLVVSLTGCSTIAGVGKDISDSAEWTRNKLSGDKK